MSGGKPTIGGGDDAAVIAENIRRLRKEKGLSQAALAAAMREADQGHWHQTTVSRVERGAQRLNLDEAEALGEILGGVFTGTAFAHAMTDLFDRLQPQMLWHHATGLAGEVERLAQHLGEAMATLEEVQERVGWLTTATREHARREAREDQADGERQ